MKTISLIQPNFQMNKEGTRFFLPYSVGSVWAYLKTYSNDVKLNRMVFMREPLEELARQISNDTLVGFSSYIWNRQFNLELAKRVKQLNPNSIIVFGGPEMEILDYQFFEKYPFIDMHVVNEGEITFKTILDNLDDWESIPNIIYNDGGKTKNTQAASRIMNLEQIPSPYLTGVFDDILEKHLDYTFVAVFETNRGCPYQCTFCDWGSLTYSKIRKFPLERVFSEIEWIYNTRRIDEISVADSNFGIFVERDEQIVDKFIEEYKRTNHKIEWQTAYAKNQNIAVAKMVKKLSDNTQAANKIIISLQTLTDSVLKDIRRKNLHVNKIKEIYQICKENDLSLSLELILGLPSETLETFKQTYYDIFDFSPSIAIQQNTLAGLNNAEITLKSQGGVEWSSINYIMNEAYEGVQEKINIVKSTDTMSNDDIIKANIFANMVIAFHFGGLTNILSTYANKIGISYKQFYEDLFEFLNEDKYISTNIQDITLAYKDWYETGLFPIKPLQNVVFGANNDKYYFQTKIHFDKKIDYLLDLIKNYTKSRGVFSEQIFLIQSHLPIKFDKQHDYPLELKYNNKNVKLLNLNSIQNDLHTFLKSFYFKRGNSFGVAKVKGLEEFI